MKMLTQLNQGNLTDSSEVEIRFLINYARTRCQDKLNWAGDLARQVQWTPQYDDSMILAAIAKK